MKTKIIYYCSIAFDEESETLSSTVWGGVRPGYRINCGERRISTPDVEVECDKYWEFVNEAIANGTLNGQDTRALELFYENLQVKGAKLADLIFSSDMRNAIWQKALEADIMVLLTDLLWIPWEALYHRGGETAAFLSDFCVLTRWPELNQQDTLANEDTPEFDRERIVCLDPLLANQIMDETDGRVLTDIFTEDGELIYVTERTPELVKEVRSTRTIHWICEHADEGLRISDDNFFTDDHCLAYRFPSRSSLFLTSCMTGCSADNRIGLGSRISASSQCTVIAPSSIVAARSGVDFIRRINRRISEVPYELRLCDLWKSIRTPAETIEHGDSPLTADTCYTLWYGIYGDCETELKVR